MYKYKPLTGISYKEIHLAFQKAFADYVVPFQQSPEELAFMIDRRGYRADISFGAFYDDELIGFTLNGFGYWNGKLTAYDTGTGVILDHRKKGVARNIFIESIPEKNRRRHIASSLVTQLTEVTGSDTLRVINSIQADEETRNFLDSIGIRKEGGQLEMIKTL